MLSIQDMSSHSFFQTALQRAMAAGSDSTEHFGGEFTGGYAIQQNPREIAALICFLMDRPRGRYLEIGSAGGGTLRLLHECLGFGDVSVIDDGMHKRHGLWKENTKNVPVERVYFGDSHSFRCAQWLRDQRIARFDIVLIDGDHEAPGVHADLSLVTPYIDSNTLVLFHDTVACPGVKEVWDAMSEKYAEFVGDVRPMGIGVAQG